MSCAPAPALSRAGNPRPRGKISTVPVEKRVDLLRCARRKARRHAGSLALHKGSATGTRGPAARRRPTGGAAAHAPVERERATASSSRCGRSGLARCRSKPACSVLRLVLRPREGGERDQRQARERALLLDLADAPHQLVAVASRQADVADQHVGPRLLQRAAARRRSRPPCARGHRGPPAPAIIISTGLAVVLHHQHVEAVQAQRARVLAASKPLSVSGASVSASPPCATGSSTRIVAPWPTPALLRGHRAAMQVHQVLDDGQPQAQAAVPPVARRVALGEAVEQVRQEFAGVMPWPKSCTSSAQPVAAAPQAHHARARPRGENLMALVIRFQKICWKRAGSSQAGACAPADFGVDPELLLLDAAAPARRSSW